MLAKRLYHRLSALKKTDAPEIILRVTLLVAFVVFVQYGWQVILHPYPVDYGEGPLLEQTVRLSQFQNIYRNDLVSPPYTISNYPPGYLLFQVPLAWIFGPAFFYGRLCSWACILSTAIVLGMTLHALIPARIPAVLSALLFLANPYVCAWSPLYRVDAMALSFSWIGLFVIIRWPDKTRRLIFAAVLMTLAVYVRQSYGLAAPMSAFVWLLMQCGWRRAFIFSALMAGLGLVGFAFLDFLTAGGFFFNIVTANMNPYHMASVADYAIELGAHFAAHLIACGLLAAFGIFFRFGRLLWAAAYMIGAVLSGLTIGKVGSNINYLLEFAAAMCMATGLFIAWMQHCPPKMKITGIRLDPSVLLYGFKIILAAQIFVSTLSGLNLIHDIRRKIGQTEETTRLARTIQHTEGIILADEYMGLLPLQGRRIYIQPFEVSQLVRGGAWDQRRFINEIAQQGFSLITMYQPASYPFYKERWTQEMLRQIDISYRPAGRIGDNVLYRPRNAIHPARRNGAPLSRMDPLIVETIQRRF